MNGRGSPRSQNVEVQNEKIDHLLSIGLHHGEEENSGVIKSAHPFTQPVDAGLAPRTTFQYVCRMGEKEG